VNVQKEENKMDRQELLNIRDGFFAAMNEHNAERMAQYCAADVIADEVAEAEPFVGVEAFQNAYSGLFEGYPDCHSKILETHMDGDVIICQVRWTATNTGVFRGIDPTDKKVDLRIAYFLTMKDGKIARITEYYDLATLLVQQGQLEL
jgi:steroid delta-isomerase-like uncharacterized protein